MEAKLIVSREIVLDTETTGTDHATGDRIVEIGAIELLNYIPTGRSFHHYVNPQRAMSQGALAVHGLSDEFLADKPVFAAIADQLHAFMGDARLVIHNASFDVGFLNAEFARTGHPPLGPERALDTLHLARRKHPGASNSLDALCSRYGIDNAKRTKHGALLDAELLAEVYIELIGGRQPDLGLAIISAAGRDDDAIIFSAERRSRPKVSRLTDTERVAHAAFVAGLGEAALWRDYLGTPE
jgi:DNA polymerase-3 subunit epsilon